MNEEKNVRQTIRISPTLYDKLNVLAKENDMSVNKLIVSILNYYIDTFNVKQANNNFIEILNSVKEIDKKIDKIDSKFNNQLDLSKQIFLNNGFRKNRTEKEDEIYQEYISMKFKK